MNKQQLFDELVAHRDSTKAVHMRAYMRDQFNFLGIQAEKRREITRAFFKEARKEKEVDWTFLKECWDSPYREYQYVGADYLNLKQKALAANDIPKIKALALTKPWWDTIDSLDKVIGKIALEEPEVNATLIEWSTADSIWLRRIAINHQRHRKEQTDVALLEKIIVANLGDTEFFINKAIGWSLRDYSKTNPAWVRSFLSKYQKKLHPLSIQEASKYLDK
ncbi:DNA alkylation repair protein [Lacticigenium naphthae]|uniref:DNA alkylation repair protein n=1 Tax=Lacticigenium naphthae TaxID=515351 RepID=UPI0004100AD5|nr:DNA alkylation repair protein [Lacticigenium naphthae]